MYTEDPPVVYNVANVMGWYAILIIVDYLQIVLQGAIRGIGYQDMGSVVALISFWVIMLPL